MTDDDGAGVSPRTIADRYVVDRAIGHGGMGTVWLCRDELLGRDVAVKEIGGLPGATRSDLGRALREARNAAALNHRNVVSVYDAIEEGDRNWLVMEYVPSRNLSQLVTEEGPLPPERVARLGAQAADGLAAAHERGTIHRDVKPGNILVTADDDVKIGDFGIARTHGEAQLTRTGIVTGTPAFFAPELARGEEPSPMADVWALGASLYAAVEGRLPYADRSNAIALLAQIATEPPAPPERAGFLAEAIERMMDPDPDTRWSMADAAHALHRLAEQGPAPATAAFAAPVAAAEPGEPSTPGASATPPGSEVGAPGGDEDAASGDVARGPGRPLALAAAVLLVVVVSIGGYLLQDRDEARTTGADETPPAETTEPTPTEEPSPDEATSEPEEPATPDEDGGTTAPTPAGFVQEYYALLPSNTRAAWQRLSPALQDRVGSYGNYTGFWRTVSAVRVDEVTAVDERVVDVVLSYETARGTESETRRLTLERRDGAFVVVGDEVVSG